MLRRPTVARRSSFHRLALCGVLIAAWPASGALAESASASGGSGGGATSRVEFRVVIPKFLSLEVGTAGATVDQIDLAPSSQQLATSPSTSVAGTGGQGSGSITVTVQASPGSDDVNLTYRTTDVSGAARPALSDGSNAVPWTTVKVATGGTNAASLAHPPALADGSTSEVSVAAPVPKVAGIINLTATWTYSWDDASTIYPASAPGGYTGRVAYKLSTP